MSDELIIGDVTMPTLKLSGLTVTKEKIWSKNTGRAANGEMIGDIIATKYTAFTQRSCWNKCDFLIFNFFLYQTSYT